jgi:hypothetical protein
MPKTHSFCVTCWRESITSIALPCFACHRGPSPKSWGWELSRRIARQSDLRVPTSREVRSPRLGEAGRRASPVLFTSCEYLLTGPAQLSARCRYTTQLCRAFREHLPSLVPPLSTCRTTASVCILGTNATHVVTNSLSCLPSRNGEEIPPLAGNHGHGTGCIKDECGPHSHRLLL